MSSESDVARVCGYMKELDGFTIDPSHGQPYGHIGATLTDAGLQAGINYERVVAPRVQRVLKEFPSASTTSAFGEVLERLGPENVLSFRGKKPLLVLAVARLLAAEGVESESELAMWLEEGRNCERLREVPGVGPKTIDYLKILVGIDTIAIDVHLMAFLESAGVKARSYDEAHVVVSRAADALGVSKAALDYAIWKYQSDPH